MKEHIKHLQWLHDRFISVHGENINVDYLIKFREIIKELQEVEEKRFQKAITDWINKDKI